MPVDEFGREIQAPPGRPDPYQSQPPEPPRSAPDNATSGERYPYHHHQQQQYPHQYPSAAPSRRAPPSRGGPPPPRRNRGPRRPPPPASSHSKRSSTATTFSSTRYVTAPLLCGYLWKQQQQQEKQQQPEDDPVKEEEKEADKDESPSDIRDPTDTPVDKEEEEDRAYTAYRRSYCASYLQHVFNAHLDDSWFRQLYSPLGRYEAALQERQRAQQEASYLTEEVKTHIQENKTEKDWKACVSLTAPPDESASSVPLRPPRWHIPRAVQEGRLLQVNQVPSYVTDAQLWAALPPINRWWDPAKDSQRGSSSSAASQQQPPPLPMARDVLQLWSSTPTQTPQNRTVYWSAPTTRVAQALWQAFQDLDGRPAASSSSSMDSGATVPWEVDCPDPYRRTEYDVDGRGGAPEDGLGVPDRVFVLPVQPYVDATTTTVLSTALSQTTRIKSDAQAAATLARALDVQLHIPAAVQLDALLERAAAARTGSDKAEGNDSDDDDDASRLDLALAYLRRVHGVNFYKGCVRAWSWANTLAGHEAASSVQFRATVDPEDEEPAADETGSADIKVKGEGTSAPDGEQTEEETMTIKEESPVKSQDTEQNAALDPVQSHQNDDKIETTATREAMAAIVSSAPKKDMLVQRLDDAIQHALTVACNAWIAAGSYVVDEAIDVAAKNLRQAEAEAEETWLRHHSIDDDGRARCSFHFCHKLFKDENFLRKHLKKKHFEYCLAEQAKCHDTYMMKAWEGAGASRPRVPGETGPTRVIVPDVMVDCGNKYGTITAALFHVPTEGNTESTDDTTNAIVDVTDPEPALWQAEQEQERLEREKRQAAEEFRARRREESRQRVQQQQSSGPRPKDKFVDVDDMKEEDVVTMTFDRVELPQPKKKKKKRKLL